MEVVLETDAGEIVIDVLETSAPRTASYFLALLDSGVYEGATFYRATDLGVPGGPKLIQGGMLAERLTSAPASTPRRPRPPVLEDIETTMETGLSHQRGTLSLARDLLGSGSALPDFFICLGRFPQLDFGGRREPDERGFPAFGSVIAGLDVVAAIAASATDGATPIAMLQGQILTEAVTITRAARR